MREIKFRAWDSFNKKMCYGKEYKVTFNGTILNMCDIDMVYQLKLMQYTGLKDKNGKEIYEGDIVQEVLPNGKYNDAPGVVNIGEFICDNSGDEYAPIACYGVHVTGSDNYWWNRRGEFIPGCVIILGNVYENPDLLGGGKEVK